MFLTDRSPNIENITGHINCTDQDELLILKYNQLKYDLVNTVIPVTTIVFSIVGLIINLIFIYLTIKGIRDRELPFKGYSLLLNRSATDVLTSFLTLVFVSLHRLDPEPDPNIDPDNIRNITINEMAYLIPNGRSMFTLLLTLNFWAAAGCYAVLALFMYLAVKHPMFYIARVTNRKTILIMIIVWFVGLMYAIIVVSISANNAFNVFNEANDLIQSLQWSVSTGDFVLSISNLFIVLFSFLIVCASYVAIIIFLWKKREHDGDAQAQLASIARIALNIFAFSISCVVMAGFVSIPLVLKGRIDQLNELVVDSKCETVVDAYRLGYNMAQWTTAAMIGWQLRMILDPVVNLALDTRFKKVWKDLCCQVTLNAPVGQMRIRSHEVAAEFLRKCAELNVMPISVISGEIGMAGFGSHSQHDRNHPIKTLLSISVAYNCCTSTRRSEAFSAQIYRPQNARTGTVVVSLGYFGYDVKL